MRRLSLFLIAGLIGLAWPSAPPAGAIADVEHRPIHFPVEGTVHYSDDFGDCRGTNCSRHHEGNDLLGSKLQHLLAARGGVSDGVRSHTTGNSGNMLALRDTDGWEYWYIHINNDTPGTDDGANP